MYTLGAPLVLGEDLIGVTAPLVHPHQGSLVAATVAVVRSRPDSHEVLGLEPLLVTLLHQLVRTHDRLQPVMLQELAGHPPAEQPAHSSAPQHPPLDLLGVRPHEVPESSRGGYFAHSVDVLNLFDCVEVGREASVKAEVGILLSGGLPSTMAARGR